MTHSPRRILGWLRWLGPLLLLAIVWRVGPAVLWQAVRGAAAGWLLLGFVLNIPQLGLKAWRWWLMVRWQGMRLSYRQAFQAYFSALLVGFLTPGRLGEMVKAVTLKHACGVSLATGLSSVVADRVFDFYFLVFLGTVGIVRYSVVGPHLSWAAFALLCAVLFVPLFFFHARGVRWLGGWAVRMPLLRTRRGWIDAKVDQFAEGLACLTPGRIALSIALTTVAYAIFFVQCQNCAQALGFRVGWIELALIMSASNFFSFIPITVSGLGTREACLIYFMARVAVPQPADVAVGFGLLIFLVLFVGGGLIGMVCWLAGPIGLRRSVTEVRHMGASQSKL